VRVLGGGFGFEARARGAATWAECAGTRRCRALGTRRFCIGRQRATRVAATERREADGFEFLGLGDHLLPGRGTLRPFFQLTSSIRTAMAAVTASVSVSRSR
jgi:hypothetical protein